MKLLFVRHGDPDYTVDSLTEKGWREAEFLAERLSAIDVKAWYVSPLGRAKDTAKRTLEKVGCEAEECSWLREFYAPIWRPDVTERKMIPWDWLPQDWMADERFFSRDQWFLPKVFQESDVKGEYDRVTTEFDLLMKKHGYERNGYYYNAIRPNNDTLVFFCHFGVSCVLLSHLLNVSPMILWHSFCAAPASVTTVATEERRAGIAAFRMLSFGDTSHLYCHNEPPAFAARFRESRDNEWERQD